MLPGVLLAVLLAITAATANTVAFQMRASDLRQRWASEQAAGVPAASLAEARRELVAEQVRHIGLLPYATVSGAVTTDPFGQPEASAAAAYRSARAAALARATTALARRHEAGGPNDAGHASRIVQLAEAVRPADADALARRWEIETARMEGVRQQLAMEAGGMTRGLPSDVVAATAGLSDLASRAEAAGIATADAGTALVHAQIYLTEPYPALLARHQGVVAELRAATDRLQQHVDVRARADDLLAKDRDLLQQVTGYGVGEELQARFDRARGALDAARLARDDAAVDAAVTELQKVDADLAAAAGGRLPLSGIACRTDAPAQLIVIHLATQQMVAYQDGCPMLRTPVTTGRAALPTGRGTFHIYYKAARYHMISPWPLGNPFYYPPTWVSNAMEFIGNGTFIHSADWQPADSYGPGSEYGPYASHGCVHVIDGPLQQLYEWAAIGTTVIVGD